MRKSIKSNKRVVRKPQLAPDYLVKKIRTYNSIVKKQNKRYNEIFSDIMRINNQRKNKFKLR